ncbi:MAG: thioesterase domain-containing protein, partial [Aquabacterium sp.]|uniref:thioesterase domain-containing protein n=1 Tax=Aquabacterium sp. TaxID=1872578 RepID=UPI002720B960
KALPSPVQTARTCTAPRNAIESQLAAIWQEVLGLDNIGVEDNFFELGGHSLTALRLLSLINRRLDWNLPLSQLLQQPTIAALATQPKPAQLSPLVALNQTEGDNPPLFCLHPAGGTVFGYYPLARALAGHRPVYGLLCRSFLDSHWQDSSITQMAADYADAVMKQQPHGPIHLLGWSLGGALALSMTRVLEQAGREVAFLGLADSFVPGFDNDDTDNQDSLGHLLPDISPELAGFDSRMLASIHQKSSTQHPTTEELKWLDVKNGLAIMQRLSALSEDYRIEAVRAGLHCWWSDEVGEVADFAQDTLEQACGSRVLSSARVPTDHAKIVRHKDFIADVLDLLGADAKA